MWRKGNEYDIVEQGINKKDAPGSASSLFYTVAAATQ